MKGAAICCARCRERPRPVRVANAGKNLRFIAPARRLWRPASHRRCRFLARAAEPVEQAAQFLLHLRRTVSSRHVSRSPLNRRSHIFLCNSRPASVISTNRPRLSILHSRRAARPSSTRRSISRDVEYCGISICFSSSTGRISPVGERDSSANASYQASGGKPALLEVLLDARPAPGSGSASGGSRRLSPRWMVYVSWLQSKWWRHCSPLKCSCINLDSFMQMHLVTRVVKPMSSGRNIPMKLYYSPGACSLSPSYRTSRSRPALRSGEGRPQSQEAGKRRRLSRHQPQGPGAGPRPRQRALVTEGPVIVQYDRRQGCRQEPGARPRQR